MAKKKISQARLKELLSYDPETGIFRARVDRRGPTKACDIAGGLDKDGYWLIGLDGCQYRAHRLAVLYMTGKMPKADVDHQDGDRADNRWEKIRDATRQQNCWNSRGHSDSLSKLKGAHFHPKTGRWLSRIRLAGKNIYLGIFNTAKEAHDAYDKRAKQHFGQFYREGERQGG